MKMLRRWSQRAVRSITAKVTKEETHAHEPAG
jgi:hypothetical protein